MALTAPTPCLVTDLPAHYAHLLRCPDREPASEGLPIVDTRDHLPLFHSLPGHVLEIGCDCGNSTTAFLAGRADTVTSIDFNPLCASNFPDSSRWTFIHGDSSHRDTISKVANQRFDVLYVDGDHSYEGAVNDLRVYSKFVRPSGLILVHDVLAVDNFPGVFNAFSQFHSVRMRAKYVLPGSYGLGVIEL